MNIDTCDLTKWNKRFYNVYRHYNNLIDNYQIIYLDDAYKKPSVNKQIAWNRIVELKNGLNGYNLTVLAAGCQNFSCAFCTDDKWYYFTREYTRVFEKLDR